MTRKMKKFLGMALSVVSIVSLTIPSVYAGMENDISYKFRIGSYHSN